MAATSVSFAFGHNHEPYCPLQNDSIPAVEHRDRDPL
jgi:hypothetical protein